jgi:hypothetical protein
VLSALVESMPVGKLTLLLAALAPAMRMAMLRTGTSSWILRYGQRGTAHTPLE